LGGVTGTARRKKADAIARGLRQLDRHDAPRGTPSIIMQNKPTVHTLSESASAEFTALVSSLLCVRSKRSKGRCGMGARDICSARSGSTEFPPKRSPWHGPRSTRAARTDAPARGEFAGARPPRRGGAPERRVGGGARRRHGGPETPAPRPRNVGQLHMVRSLPTAGAAKVHRPSKYGHPKNIHARAAKPSSVPSGGRGDDRAWGGGLAHSRKIHSMLSPSCCPTHDPPAERCAKPRSARDQAHTLLSLPLAQTACIVALLPGAKNGEQDPRSECAPDFGLPWKHA